MQKLTNLRIGMDTSVQRTKQDNASVVYIVIDRLVQSSDGDPVRSFLRLVSIAGDGSFCKLWKGRLLDHWSDEYISS